jgi:hypothetical protein
MPKTCYSNLSKIVQVVQPFADRPLNRLEVLEMLLEILTKKNFQIERASLVRYRDKMRNWQIADSVIFEAIRRRDTWEGATIWDDPPPYRLQSYYDQYCQLATDAGLKPLKYPTFKGRASDFPSPFNFRKGRK